MNKRTILCSYCNTPLQVDGEDNAKNITCPKCDTKTEIPELAIAVEELDFYDLDKPYSYISILKEKDTLKKRYVILEPALSKDNQELLSFLMDTIIKTLDVRLDELEDKAESYLIKVVDDILKKYEIVVDGVVWEKILYYLKKRFLGYNDIEPLMKDPYIEDISCDGAKVPLFVYQRQFGSLETNIVFSDDENLAKFVVKLAQKCGKHISVSEPMLDATMPDGSRIQMTLHGEVTTRGSTFTIRKFRADPITPVDLIGYDTLSIEMMAYLWMAVEHGFNALISGGTASGKTSTLNALALFIPRESKIVSIEETREINLPHPNWIPGVTRSGFGEVVNARMVGEIDLFDLMKAALRQRPEYILVGEIRGREAYVLFQAMATGHTTYSTVHADSTQALIHRLEGKPINIPRTMLQSLDIVLIMRTQKTQDKQQRRCIKIVELLNVDNETNEVLTNIVFEWDPQLNQFHYTGKSYILEQIRSQIDMNADEMTKELRQRANILQWMEKNHIRKFIEVSNILSKYAETPEKVLDLITKKPEKIDEEIKESLFTLKSNFDFLLDNPNVISRNEKAKELEKSKQDNNSIIKSIFTRNQTKTNDTLSLSKKNSEEVRNINSEVVLNKPFFIKKKNPVSFFSKTKELTISPNSTPLSNLETIHSNVQKEMDEKLKEKTIQSSEKKKKNSLNKKENVSISTSEKQQLAKSNKSQKKNKNVSKKDMKKKMSTLRKLSKTRIRVKKRKK